MLRGSGRSPRPAVYTIILTVGTWDYRFSQILQRVRTDPEFRVAGGSAEHRLVFTHDEEPTINRIADEVDAQAYAIPGVAGTVDRLLVSLSGKVATDRIVAFVEDLVGDLSIGVTLFIASKNPENDEERIQDAEDR